MSDHVKIWDPNDWEDNVKALLRVHYGPGQFVEVPAKHGGDFGIEGFSRTGCAYQCYAAQESLSTEDLYVKQRDKATTDLGKFVKNRADLLALLGATNIYRWILMVPRFESAKLVQHLEKKSEEVRLAKLPYAAEDFHACVETDDLFTIERAQLSDVGLAKVSLPINEVPTGELSAWNTDNYDQIAILEGKLAVLIGPSPSLTDLQSSRNRMIAHLLQGQNVLQNLHLNYPQMYQSVRRCKDSRENFLTTLAQVTSPAPQKLFNEVLAQFKNELAESNPGLDRYTAEVLVWEAVADWLVRCPLSFRGTNHV